MADSHISKLLFPFTISLTLGDIDGVKAVQISHDGKFIVSGALDKSIMIFDMEDEKVIHKFANAHAGI